MLRAIIFFPLAKCSERLLVWRTSGLCTFRILSSTLWAVIGIFCQLFLSTTRAKHVHKPRFITERCKQAVNVWNREHASSLSCLQSCSGGMRPQRLHFYLQQLLFYLQQLIFHLQQLVFICKYKVYIQRYIFKVYIINEKRCRVTDDLSILTVDV